MLNLAFYDSESQRVSKDFPDGWGTPLLRGGQDWTNTNTLLMGYGMGCIYDNDGIKLYPDAFECLQTLLSPAVDAIVTFNGEGFDFPLLLGELEPPEAGNLSVGFNEALAALEAKSIDILKAISRTLGYRISLDQITSVMFDRKKEISGVEWWPLYNGDFMGRTVAVNYLLGDVMQLYKIYGVGYELGELAFRDKLGTVKKFAIKMPTPLDFKA